MTPLVNQPLYLNGIRIKHTPAEGKHTPEHNQIVLRFANGYEMSIVYGAMMHSRDTNGSPFTTQIPTDCFAGSVEIAITDPQNEFVKFRDGDTVKGYTDMIELATIIAWVSTR